MYESLLVAAILFVTGFALLPLMQRVTGSTLAVPPAGARALSFGVLFSVLGAYFVLSWSGGRRTLAMKTWHLRLVTADGLPVTRRHALLRYVACCVGPALALVAYLGLHRRGHSAHAAWLLAANFAWALIDRDGRFLQDRLAGTTLRYEPRAARARPSGSA